MKFRGSSPLGGMIIALVVALLVQAKYTQAQVTAPTYLEQATGNEKQAAAVAVVPAAAPPVIAAAITSATASAAFTPTVGRIFHVQLSGTGVGTCVLVRKLDGSLWVPITLTAGGSTVTMYNWSYTGSKLSEDVMESQTGATYRVDCGAEFGSYTSGTINVRIS